MILYDLDAKNNIRLSPYCWRVKTALRHKGIVWEERPVAFTDIPALGFKTVPVLIDGDKQLSESFDIIAYLDKTYPAKQVITQISEAKFFENWCLMTLHMPLALLVLKDIYDVVVDKDKPYIKESREKRFNISLDTVQNGREERVIPFRALLNPVRKTLETNPFLGGNSPTYFDYCLWGTLKWGKSVATFELFEKDDSILAWFNRVSETLEFK